MKLRGKHAAFHGTVTTLFVAALRNNGRTSNRTPTACRLHSRASR